MLFKDHYNKQLKEKIKEYKDSKFKDCPGPVLGYGSLDASIMFIGEAPKRDDIIHGVPFTGIAKNRMVKAIEDNELKKGEYYFTYLIKHQLAEDSRPEIIEHKTYLDILLEEIESINPRIVCSMGFYITKFLMSAWKMKEESMSMADLCGNGYIVPAIQSTKRKKGKTIARRRPKRYLLPTWSPSVENSYKNNQFETDIQTLKSIKALGILLFE